MIDLPVIPRPVRLELTGSSWSLPDRPRVLLDTGNSGFAADELPISHLVGFLPSNVIITADTHDDRQAADVTVRLISSPEKCGDEGYCLRIQKQQVTIEASSHSGFVWGLQTLGQILSGDSEIPCLVCHDHPRFRWRGMHLDVARHFFPVDFLLKFLSLLSRYKFNTFHWHLTDDQGWRLAIDSYPRLAEIGAWRTEADGTRYGGYYTCDDVSTVVAHARRLGIRVIPEIDLPGHSSALLAAYPELSCDGQPVDIPNSWGIFNNTLCPSRDSTFRFVESVLTEVAEMFDSRYIHIGGDECPADNWAAHYDCKNMMAHQHLDSASKLQGYFNNRTAKILNSLGLELLGWDEILEFGAPANSTVMCWRDIKLAEQSVGAGHEVVMCPMSHCYFDFYQAKEGEPKAIGGHLPLEKVYEFEPLGSELLEANSDLVLGGQGNLWTEYMETTDHIEYMTIPRICALSEVLWSEKSSRDYASFTEILPAHINTLNRAGYNSRPL